MLGPGGKAQSLCAARDGGIIDRLHIDTVFGEQGIADLFCFNRVANHQRYDMGFAHQHRQPRFIEHRLQHRGIGLLRVALFT